MQVIEIDAGTLLEALESALEVAPAAPPTPAQVCEAVAAMGMLSDPESRWLQPAVRA